MTDTTPAPAPKNTSLKGPAAIALEGLAVAAGLYFVFGYLFFGYAGLLLIFFAVLSLAFSLILLIEIQEGAKKIAVGLAGLAVFTTCVSLVPASFAVGSAKDVVNGATRQMGVAPPIASTLQPMLENVQTYRANKAFVQDFSRPATSRQDEVLRFLDLAREFGVNAEFVTRNGIVRVSDRQEIYRAALAQAARGDDRAIAFLENSPH